MLAKFDHIADLVQISGNMNCHQTFAQAAAGIASVFAVIRKTKNRLRKAPEYYVLAKIFATRQNALKNVEFRGMSEREDSAFRRKSLYGIIF